MDFGRDFSGSDQTFAFLFLICEAKKTDVLKIRLD